MKPGLLMLPSAVSNSRVHNILPNKIDTDFQFSRASAATRVNHQGLIEDVGYFGPELVQNGDFSELGSELAPADDFAADFVANPSSGTVVNSPNGTLTFTNSTSSGANVQLKNRSITTTKTYKIQFTISNYVAGTFRMSVGNNITNAVSANGNYTFYVEYTAGLDRNYFYTNNSTLTVSNISVKQVDPDDDWTLGTGWSYGSNKVTGSATQAEVSQDIDLPSGKVYKTTFTIEDYVSGEVRIRFRGGTTVNGTPHGGNGTYTEILTSTGHTNIKIDGTSAFTGSVTNVSVVEVLGDRPRLDYDPLNPTCPHLLLEPQSTNLIQFSEDYSQNAWLKTNLSIISDSIKSPSGIINSDKLIPDTTNGQHKIDITKTVSSGAAVALSAFVKKGEYEFVCLYEVNSAKGRFYNLNDGTQGGTFGGTPTTSNIEELPNDWYKISITTTVPSTSARYIVYVCDTISNTAFIGDNIKGLYVWGTQLEELSYATSYIPTAGSTITRVGETCNNAGNIDTFNDAEGVLYAEIAALANDGTFREITLNDGTVDNVIEFRYNNVDNEIQFVVRDGGSVTVNSQVAFSDVLEYNKIALQYKANDFKVFANGSQVATDTAGSVPSGLNQLDFSWAENNKFYGKTKSLATYNRALTDNELYTITSTQYSAYSGMVAALGNYTIPC